MPIITVSCSCGSYGPEIAQRLADRLGYTLYTRTDLLTRFFKSDVSRHVFRMLEESPRFYSEPYRDGQTYADHVTEALKDLLTAAPNAVIIGFGARQFLQQAGLTDTLHLRISAAEETRIQRIVQRYHMDADSAAAYIAHWDRKFHRFVSVVFNQDLNRSDLYDACFNTDTLSPDACIDAIYALAMDAETRIRLKAQKEEADRYIMDDIPEMKNASEVAFAHLLDRYQIEWRYEPKTFPVEWDDNGAVLTAFRPDFYLPKFDLYLELTTMDQKYVARKNRKARLARERYGIDVKIVYRRDYNAALHHLEADSTEAVSVVDQHVDTDIESERFIVTADLPQPTPADASKGHDHA